MSAIIEAYLCSESFQEVYLTFTENFKEYIFEVSSKLIKRSTSLVNILAIK